MKQIIQSFKTGETILEEVPAPQVKRGQVLIKTRKTLVSLGTERMLVEFGKSNLIAKARQQPDKVKMVLDKIKSDGLMPTLEAVFNKLEQPLPLGYCNVGEVIEVGEGVYDFKVGDRVASNGNHAEFVCVPQNLVAHIPDNVSDDEATFTVIGAIGLQGIRLLNPTLGETIVVSGLGLIGLITAELLKANGCKVVGFDFDQQKVDLAKSKGIEAINLSDGTDPVKFVESYTKGIGADGVIITASSKSDEIISQCARMSRKRGRIILVGVIGLNLSRAEFYEKELTFQVSCSYGPGRYDDDYEQKGIDYPLPFVRWTENRNFQAVLEAIASGVLDVKPLITEVVKLHDYQQVYGNIGTSRSIASILDYPQESVVKSTVNVNDVEYKPGKASLGIIGAGNFTKMTMLPALQKVSANIKYIVSAGGVSGTHLAKKYDIPFSSTNYNEVLEDKELDMVMITTRHDLHAKMSIQAIEAGKHVFVEKPLAIKVQDVKQVVKALEGKEINLTVGFNRRFAPFAIKMKQLLGNANEPMNVIATMNAGFIPPEVWVHDMEVGGGRIIGEACHFIDLITYLTGSKVASVCMSAMGVNPKENTDNATILLKYENGSQGVINYFANGHKAYAKERVEVYSQGRTLIMDNWRKLTGFGFKGFSSASSSQDKGHANQFKVLIDRLKEGGSPIIPFAETLNTTLASFAAIESFKQGKWMEVTASLFEDTYNEEKKEVQKV
jgi:predicted dehydrogenase/threonine dehydrogenase-like Zn-dependent dehydrogenase